MTDLTFIGFTAGTTSAAIAAFIAGGATAGFGTLAAILLFAAFMGFVTKGF